jgi:hypothetical protein
MESTTFYVQRITKEEHQEKVHTHDSHVVWNMPLGLQSVTCSGRFFRMEGELGVIVHFLPRFLVSIDWFVRESAGGELLMAVNRAQGPCGKWVLGLSVLPGQPPNGWPDFFVSGENPQMHQYSVRHVC